jgi:hypothetical protein
MYLSSCQNFDPGKNEFEKDVDELDFNVIATADLDSKQKQTFDCLSAVVDLRFNSFAPSIQKALVESLDIKELVLLSITLSLKI